MTTFKSFSTYEEKFCHKEFPRLQYYNVYHVPTYLVESLSLSPCFLFCHLLPQSFFFLSAESFGFESLLMFYSHHLHPPDGNDLSEVALQLDNAVETTSEPLTSYVSTAMSLESHHTSSHHSVVSCELSGPPGGFKPVETFPHLLHGWLRTNTQTEWKWSHNNTYVHPRLWQLQASMTQPFGRYSTIAIMETFLSWICTLWIGEIFFLLVQLQVELCKNILTISQVGLEKEPLLFLYIVSSCTANRFRPNWIKRCTIQPHN